MASAWGAWVLWVRAAPADTDRITRLAVSFQHHRPSWAEGGKAMTEAPKTSEIGGTNEPLLLPAREDRSEEHTSELQSQSNLVCRLLLEKKKKKKQSDCGIT